MSPAPASTRPAFFTLPSLAPDRRAVLERWRAQLTKTVERCEESAGTGAGQAHEFAESNVLGALVAIREETDPLRRALLDEATAAVAPYFSRLGDAREAARYFPAILAFRDFTHGPPLETSLSGLRRQARDAAAILETLLAARPIWTLTGSAE